MASRTCTFVPPYLLRQIASGPGLGVTVDPHAVDSLQPHAAHRRVVPRGPCRPSADFRVAEAEAAVAGPAYTVHTADNTATLPGTPVRSADQAEPSGDVAVDEAWVGIEASLALFREVYGRDSFDGAGAFVSATVHYEQDYDNAFWDGTQLVFGDGDGQVFDRFTKPVDVLGHEFTHAVTERTAGLVYEGQSGALNESVSDVFATCMKQRLLGQTADQGDWLIGAGLFLPGINGTALRSMSAPGTAYDDPALGKDPQPADMSGYIETTDDNGGVHLNSGHPQPRLPPGGDRDRRLVGRGCRPDLVRRAGCGRGGRRLRRLRGRLRGRRRCLMSTRCAPPGPRWGCWVAPRPAPLASPAPAPARRPGRRGAALRRDRRPHRRPARSTSTATTRGPARCATWSTGSTWPRSPRAGCTRTRSSTTSWWAAGPPGSWAPTCPTTSAGWPSCCSPTPLIAGQLPHRRCCASLAVARRTRTDVERRPGSPPWPFGRAPIAAQRRALAWTSRLGDQTA